MKKKSTLVHKRIFTFSLITVLLFDSNISLARQASSAEGSTYYTVYRYGVAATGSCLPDHNSNPSAILQRNGIKTLGNPSSDDIAALAKGLAQVENLLDSPLPQSWRQNYNFMYATGAWNQGAEYINIRRPKGSDQGTNVARLMHELGHKVGNSGIYQKYASYTGRTRCEFTGYAATKFNEEFAEVFAAFVTYPDILVKKCPKAYAFMTNQLFPNSSEKIATCDGSAIASNKGQLPFDRPDDFDTLSEEESQKDVVVTLDDDDEEEEDFFEDDSGGTSVGAVLGLAGFAAVMAMNLGKDKAKSKATNSANNGPIAPPIFTGATPPASSSAIASASTVETPPVSTVATPDTGDDKSNADDENKVTEESVPEDAE